jgi:hypothetical protein
MLEFVKDAIEQMLVQCMRIWSGTAGNLRIYGGRIGQSVPFEERRRWWAMGLMFGNIGIIILHCTHVFAE